MTRPANPFRKRIPIRRSLPGSSREDKAMTDCPSRRADDRIREASRTENTRSSEGISQDRQLKGPR
jgi:hypothetical protein